MEKISQTVAEHVTIIQKRLESFLENDLEDSKPITNERTTLFEPTKDLAVVNGISMGLPEDHVDKAIVVFTRLSMLFDAGVLLENQDSQWHAQAVFQHGQTELLPRQNKIKIKLPGGPIMSVLKTDAASVLKKLNLGHIDPENRTTCVLIKVSADFSFLLFSLAPELWLRDHIINVQESLMKGFAD